MMKYALIILLLLSLSACSLPAADIPQPASDAAAAPTLSQSPEKTSSPGALLWDDSPAALVVQHDEYGGMMDMGPGAHVPLWTLYGDGLVVWAGDGAPTLGFDRQVWLGRLSERDIETLLSFIEEIGFFSLQPEYKAPAFAARQNDDDSPPVLEPNPQGGPDQPTGVILVDLRERSHRVTVYPANWDEVPGAYKSVRAYLLALHPSDASPFVPESFYIEVTPITAETTHPPAQWPFDIPLQPKAHVTPEQARAVSDFLADGNLVEFEGRVYQILLKADPPR
jgi:hypothetical protein